MLVFTCLLVSGCDYSSGLAPVLDRSLVGQYAPNTYRVQQGDTLYSIAWTYQLDYHQLARLNRLVPPYRLRIGQVVCVKAIVGHTQQKKLLFRQMNVHPAANYFWHWPAKGKLVGTFSVKDFADKGISIAGQLGEPVVASVNGRVVYSGAGVRGYGNLIIIKHDQNYLSAYAFNQRNLVKDGERVASGQKIAEMGRDSTGRVLLYFEIRRNGQPVDPLPYLRWR